MQKSNKKITILIVFIILILSTTILVKNKNSVTTIDVQEGVQIHTSDDNSTSTLSIDLNGYSKPIKKENN